MSDSSIIGRLDRGFLASPQQPKRDAVSLLTCYIILLFCLPSRLVVGPLGSAGTPAALVGIGALMLWIWQRLNRTETVQIGPQPIRAAMGCFLAVVGICQILAMLRPINPEEVSTADAAILAVAGWLGIVLTANDLIHSRPRFDVLVNRVVFAAGALATLGVVQFIFKQSFIDQISVPGLKANVMLYPILDRSGFPRPAGTALHPIEFGTTLTVLLPIALVRAVNGSARSVIRAWFPVASIAIAIPLSVSRSSLVGAVIGLLIVVPTWTRSARRAAYVALAGLVVVVFLTVPGLLGTLRNLFTSINEDSSAQSRTDSYDIAWTFIQRSPLFGRGLGTFLPRYRIFDNEYLGLLVEIGIVGLLATVSLLATAFFTVRRVRRLTDDNNVRQQAQGLAAAIAVAACSMALFDALSFPMFTGTIFLVLGLAGSLRRITQEERTFRGVT
jgi:O-antigen ligase